MGIEEMIELDVEYRGSFIVGFFDVIVVCRTFVFVDLEMRCLIIDCLVDGM